MQNSSEFCWLTLIISKVKMSKIFTIKMPKDENVENRNVDKLNAEM
jgi:hypothetical protein